MDQIANMVNMIKNSNRVGHETITVPYSNLKQSIAECLVKEGFVKSFSKKTKKGFPVLEIILNYIDGKPRVSGAKRVSKLSCRVYAGVKDMKSVRSDHGSTILTTPKGILTARQAQKEMVGGEVLFRIW